MIKVSIIIPIYNPGEKLFNCLKSISNQSLKEIEIICVLDAPTDSSEKVVADFAKKDSRFKILKNESNLHVSESRNRGIKLAIGSYIAFSDNDDIHDVNMYKLLYEKAIEMESDIVFSSSFVKNGDDVKIIEYFLPTRAGVISSIILPMENKNNKNYLSKSVWASIYKKDFIVDNNIIFKDQRVFFSEDTLFNLEAFLNTDKIFYISKPLYFWIKHESSLSNQWVNNIAIKTLNFFEEIFNLLNNNNQFQLYKNDFQILLEDTINLYLPYYKLLSKENLNRLSNLLIKSDFKIIGKYSSLKIISKKRMKLYVFISILKFKNINKLF